MQLRRLMGFAAMFFLALTCLSTTTPFDLIIRNGRIVDGGGNPWFTADLGIIDAKIAAIGHLADREARRRIDANGRIVAPGFIDMMGGLARGDAQSEVKVRQGITTSMSGEGVSIAPSDSTEPDPMKRNTWPTFGEYFQFSETQAQTINTVFNVGATRVRQLVLGQRDVAPTPEQLERMKAHVDQAMRDGVVGLSTALGYTPAIYAKTEELIELAKVAARYGGAYFSHIRNESAGVLEAIDEAIRIGKEAHVPVHIFHLKAAGQRNWGLMIPALQKIRQARDGGVDITADIYPYTRNQIGLGAFIPPRRLKDGPQQLLAALADPKVRAELREEIETTSDWENWYLNVGRDWGKVWVVFIGKKTDPRFLGKSIQEIAVMTQSDPWQVFFDLFSDMNGISALVMDEEQKREALKAPFVMFGCDGMGAHPRGFGTFPRILAKYVRDEHVISVEEAVRKMTSLPANRLGLWDRGRIGLGMAADLVIFDPDRIQDMATYENPTQVAVGMDYVIIAGQAVIDDGKMTALRPGRTLKRRSAL